MAPETMMAVRRLVIGPPRKHQQPHSAQKIEQRIPADAKALGAKLGTNQVVQLARPQPGLAQAFCPDQFQHPFVLCFFLYPAVLPLVMCLPADPHVAASPRHV